MDYSITKDSVCLFATPQPFLSESPSSWIQRICGAHQYTRTSLMKILKTWPIDGEWDSHQASAALKQVCKFSGYEGGACEEAIFGFERVQKAYCEHSFLSTQFRASTSKWCAECLATDAIPHLRWEWRLEDFSYCGIHKSALFEKCCWCDQPLAVGRTLLVGRGCMDLTTCSECGMSLTDSDPHASGQSPESAFDPNDPMLEAVSTLKMEFSKQNTQIDLPFERLPAPASPGSDSLSTSVRKNGSPSLSTPLLINAATFSRNMNLHERRPQSGKISTPEFLRYQKFRMARSLRIVRNDKRKNPEHYVNHDPSEHELA